MDKKLSFEEASARLEEIINLLDSKDVELDKSLDLFKEGVSLIKYCNDKLDSFEGEVKKLVNVDGEIVEEDFDVDEGK